MSDISEFCLEKVKNLHVSAFNFFLVCINLHCTSTKHLLQGHKHFSQSIMVSDAVLKLVFVQPGAKIKHLNSAYYCDHALEQGLLPDIRH